MRRLSWVVLVLAALAGCDAAGSGNALGLCSTVCRCLAPGLPGQQQECVDECAAGAGVQNVTAACEECVFENASSCDDLLTRCEQPCSRPQPLPDTGAPGGSDDL
ncbi:MAG TPA: hypothetical protein VK932_23595 [Kofleriaceae bacterium]|nr:hypothetical protein [Kofleriaceae bacterium]